MPMLSFTTMASPDWDGETAIKKAREYGYQGVDLRISDHLGELKLSSTDAEIRELRHMFYDEGIISSSLLAYNAQATSDPGSWDIMRDSVSRNLEIGAKLGTKLVRIFVGNPDVAQDHKGFLDHTADILAQVLERDVSATSLIIQNHVGGGGVSDVLYILKRVDHPRLNMVLCPANASCMNEAIMELLPVLADSLPQVYIADLIREKSVESGHEKSVLPGTGYIDYPAIYKALGGDAFKGWLSFKWEKIWSPELPGPEIALPYFVDYMQKIKGHDPV